MVDRRGDALKIVVLGEGKSNLTYHFQAATPAWIHPLPQNFLRQILFIEESGHRFLHSRVKICQQHLMEICVDK